MTNYSHNPGIHFEKLGELRLFNNKWKLVTFVDFNGLNDKFLSLRNYYDITVELCEHKNIQYHYYICDLFLKSSRYSLDKIKVELDLVHELMGENVLRKNKRGWFDIVDKASKVLFGTFRRGRC